MCGFAGILLFDHEAKANPDIVRKMTDTIAYRGPDEEGYFSSGQCALGNRRLKIIDLVTGQQPMYNEDGSVVIVYNGEVYNFLELRSRLETKGHRFKTKSDTEVIIHAYEEWGENFIQYLRGVFAFAIWDQNKKKLILARDRMGVRPAYYYIDSKQIIFGSEIKAILANPDVPRSIDPSAIYCYFSLAYVPGPFSGVKNVTKLLQGHMLVVKNGKPQLKRYWELKADETKRFDPEQAKLRLREEIFRAVKEELVSDVPLGVFLSGGIDSSSVLAAASHSSPEPINAYTVGFKEEYWDESEKAAEVAKILNAKHKLLYNDPRDLADLMKKLIWYMDEPHANYTMVANYLVCQAAREEITVALSGMGGDEIFGGYRQYQAEKISSYYTSIVPFSLRKIIFAALRSVLSYNDQEPSFQRMLARATSIDDPDPVKRHLAWTYFGGWHESVSSLGLFHSDAFREIKNNGPDPFDHLARFVKEYGGKDRLNKFFYLIMYTQMIDDLNTMTDRMSMANSLEVRTPILDHELVELVFSLPSSFKMPGLKRKYLLKNYLYEFLPQRIVNMPKQGFGIPLMLWIKNELRDMIADVISSSNLHQDPLIKQKVVDKAFQEHLEGKRDHTARIWSVVAYLMWKEAFNIS